MQRREVDLMLEEGPIDPETPSAPEALLPAVEPVAVAPTPADTALPQEPPRESVPVDPTHAEPTPDQAAPTAALDGRITQPLEGY